jgi:predicted DCC family thiol-disulfide oxidoreductase YuxK
VRFTLIYDESCGLCRLAIAVFLRLDRAGRIRPLSFRDAVAQGVLDEQRRPLWSRSWHLRADDGQWWSAGAALPPLVAALGGGRTASAALRRFPAATERAYRLVADHRDALGPLVPARPKRWADALISRRTARS